MFTGIVATSMDVILSIECDTREGQWLPVNQAIEGVEVYEGG